GPPGPAAARPHGRHRGHVPGLHLRRPGRRALPGRRRVPAAPVAGPRAPGADPPRRADPRLLRLDAPLRRLLPRPPDLAREREEAGPLLALLSLRGGPCAGA